MSDTRSVVLSLGHSRPAPKVGDIIYVPNNGRGFYLPGERRPRGRATAVSAVFTINADHPSYCGSHLLGCEGERGCRVTYTPIDDAEGGR